MPIYEYEALDPIKGCKKCRVAFEILQSTKEKPLTLCSHCGGAIRKVISWCRAAVAETSEEHNNVMRQVKDYENEGMWSHAAELADKHSEKTKDKGLKGRALDNYKKAGYDAATLDKHSKSNND